MLLVVDKPSGITSFDIIRALKRELNEKKIGHSGTLDPMATGLMIIGTGKDTKKLCEITGLDKQYITTIDFSKKSDTWDLDYWEYFEILKKKDLKTPDRTSIKNTLNTIIPEGNLPLTPFSAKKKNGKKLYELARNGEKIIENKIMKINGYEIINYHFPTLEIKLDVGSGTYIRSISHRLGEQFGIGGILISLRRISIGECSLEKINLDKKGIFFHKERGEIPFEYKILPEIKF